MKIDKKYKFFSLLLAIIFQAFFIGVFSVKAREHTDPVDFVYIEKIFPFISSLKSNAEVYRIIMEDEVLSRNKYERFSRLQKLSGEFKNASSYSALLKWSTTEITEIGNRLVTLCLQKREMQDFLSAYKRTGPYKLYETKSDTAFIRACWNDVASGINNILDVYIDGTPPLYPAIDGISDFKGELLFKKVQKHVNKLLSENNEKDLFFDFSLTFAIRVLIINERDEAIRYEPLSGGMNENAFKSIDYINWQSYQYSLILVPGHGPEEAGVAIDSITINRCKLALESYKNKLAPYLVVSGGHVHPNKTAFCEAVEMKKYMVNELHVPDSVIFIEPHARHTTTNLRNVSRMVYRFQIPDTMKILTVTDTSQSAYILRMEKRAVKELRYVPYQNLTKITESKTEFSPVVDVLQPNPLDPLDP